MGIKVQATVVRATTPPRRATSAAPGAAHLCLPQVAGLADLGFTPNTSSRLGQLIPTPQCWQFHLRENPSHLMLVRSWRADCACVLSTAADVDVHVDVPVDVQWLRRRTRNGNAEPILEFRRLAPEVGLEPTTLRLTAGA
jgi:hypothetical protein